ncbi:MAG: sulfotransferase [Chitinophagales bacterium]
MEVKEKLPTFLIVGAVKAGTTSLHMYLQQHPEVYMSPVKETNFFSDADMDFAHFNLDYRQDVSINIEKYIDGPMDKKVHIAHVRTWDLYKKLFRFAADEKALGEVSNSYLYLPSTAKVIHERLPNARIVMILRNPVERLFSQFLMNVRLGKIAERDLLKELKADAAKAYKGWGVSHLYVEVGMYYAQVKRYLDLFPKEQVHIILFDDFKQDPKKAMRDLFGFIGADPDFPVDMETKYNEAGMPRFGKLNYFLTQTGLYTLSKKLVPERLKDRVKSIFYSGSNVPKLSAAEREYLISLYTEDIRNLERLLGRSLENWLK